MKPQPSPPTNPSTELAAVLDAAIPADMLAKTLFNALTATTTTRAGTLEPDTRSQLQAASLILAYKVGRPIERSEVVSINLDADSSVGLKERLASSPAMRSALAKLLNDSGAAVDV